jgi:glycerol uptake facilitator-like aquaporin
MQGMARSLAAEFFGTLFLLIAVVGSGIMAERLAGGNMAVALLANAIATGAALVVLITILGPLSGAHLNPAVSFYFALQGKLRWHVAGLYALAQITGAILGVWLTHMMFAVPVLDVSTHLREGSSQFLAEFIATAGLLATIAGATRFSPSSIPMLVGLYITGAYWFTASTSFANPAVTVARTLTDSFSGIALSSAPAFIIAQLIAAALAAPCLKWLFNRSDNWYCAPTRE